MSITPLINELEAMEETLRSIDHLCSLGVINRGVTTMDAGDWEVRTWSHSLDGYFTVGSMERVRQNDAPFPYHVHAQRLWILVSCGRIRVDIDNMPSVTISPGEYVVINPGTHHAVLPLEEKCVVVFVTIPSDQGFRNE